MKTQGESGLGQRSHSTRPSLAHGPRPSKLLWRLRLLPGAILARILKLGFLAHEFRFLQDHKFGRPPIMPIAIDPPLVSAIIVVHNQSRREIQEAITSVRQQYYPRIEIVVIDDGSSHPETKGAVRDLTHSRNFIVIQTANNGVVEARNRGRKEASGDYCFFLDADDSVSKTYVNQLLPLLLGSRDSSIVIAHSDTEVRDLRSGVTRFVRTYPLLFALVRLSNSFSVSALMSTTAFDEAGGFSSEFESGYEDWELWTRLASIGYRSSRAPLPLFTYRRKKGSRHESSSAFASEYRWAIRQRHPFTLFQDERPPRPHRLPAYADLSRFLVPTVSKPKAFLFVGMPSTRGQFFRMLKVIKQFQQTHADDLVLIVSEAGWPRAARIAHLQNLVPMTYVLSELDASQKISAVATLLSSANRAKIMSWGSRWFQGAIKYLVENKIVSESQLAP